MTINEKISKIREVICNGDNSEFAARLGVSTQYASNICKNGKNVGEKQKQHILDVFPDISRSWLLADEGSMLKDLPGCTNSENTNQKSDDMIHDNFFQALKRRDKQIDEMLAQQSRLIGVIERLHGITDAGARISPPLQNQGQDCLK